MPNDTEISLRRAHIIALLLVFLVPFQLHYDYLLNLFYHAGAAYFDAGLFAHLLWHNDWTLMNPHLRGDFSYFGVHFSPFLLAVSQLSHFAPTHMVEFFAFFMASIYAALSLALYRAQVHFWPPTQLRQIAGMGVVAIAFAFNGIVTKGMWLPHFEFLMPLTIFLLLWHLQRRNKWLSVFFLALTLSLREDAGVHLAAIVGLIGLVRYWQQRQWLAVRTEFWLAAGACVYSLLTWAITASVPKPPGSLNVFSQIYSGDPAFAHLSIGLMAQRAQHMLAEHIHLWLGCLVTLVWAWRTRDPYLPLGFAAYAPWIVLNMLAKNANTGYLYAYYAFPFVLSLSWPLLAVRYQYGENPALPVIRRTLILQAILVAIGLVAWDGGPNFGPNSGAKWGGYRLLKGAVNASLIHEFVAKFNAGVGDLGVVAADNGTASLVGGYYHKVPVELLYGYRGKADTLLYMCPLPLLAQEVSAQVARNNCNHRYRMAGAPICMASNRTISQLANFGALMNEE